MKSMNITRSTRTAATENAGDPCFRNFGRGMKTTTNLLKKDGKAFWKDWMRMDNPHKVISWGVTNFVAGFAGTMLLTKILVFFIKTIIKFCCFVADRTR